MLKLELFTGSIGSNPGGKCIVTEENKRLLGYFKYVYGTRIQDTAPFQANHQAIYEGITFSLVRLMGLKTTGFFVIDNRDRKADFVNWKNHLEHDPSGRDFYFLSELMAVRNSCEEKSSNEQLQKDIPYLKATKVSDIVGKRQNYTCQKNGGDRIYYLDLGCSFVYAKEGYLSLPHRFVSYDSKLYRNLMKKLTNAHIVSRDNDTILNLAEIVTKIPNFEIPSLNRRTKMTVKEVLNADEIREIQYNIATGLDNTIPMFEDRGLLF